MCRHRNQFVRLHHMLPLRLIKSTTWILRGAAFARVMHGGYGRHVARTYGTLPLQYYAADMAKAKLILEVCTSLNAGVLETLVGRSISMA